jgi:hypothetical protein
MAIVMQIGLVAWMIEDPPQDIVFLLEGTWCHGEARNNRLSQNPQLKQSIGLCHKA